MTAYHEHTHQKRAVINLNKAHRLVDGKTNLVSDPNGSTKPGKGRRKSAFAEEDEGYQYVDEGFRIRFANGETIDFYADSVAEKDAWMEVLKQVVGKPDQSSRRTMWTDIVVAKERAEAAKQDAHDQSIQQAQQQRGFGRSGSNAGRRHGPASSDTRSTPHKSPYARPRTPPLQSRAAGRTRDARATAA